MNNMSCLRLISFLALLSLSTPVFSFTITNNNQRTISHVRTIAMHSKRTTLFSTEPNQNEMTAIPLPETSVTTPNEPEGTQYPLDVPSPILLATSMVLAIVGTGSAFELVNPDPRFGFATTAVLALVAIPLCFFLFYASILKATAETEADDKEFMKGRY